MSGNCRSACPPRTTRTRTDESWLSVIPRNLRQPYKMRPIIEGLMDRGSVFEMGRYFGRSVITCLARLNGLPVAVLAGDPMFYAGSWTADACAKVIRFVDLAETFHLPVVYLMDCPGFMIGLEAEQRATIRWGVRAMAAVNQSTVPWCTVIVRNAFGVAGVVHQPASRFSVRHAWPSARWGIAAAGRRDRGGLPGRPRRGGGPRRRSWRRSTHGLQLLRSPLRTAEAFWVEEIIDPRQTRRLLCEFAGLAERVLEPGMRAHGMRP